MLSIYIFILFSYWIISTHHLIFFNFLSFRLKIVKISFKSKQFFIQLRKELVSMTTIFFFCCHSRILFYFLHILSLLYFRRHRVKTLRVYWALTWWTTEHVRIYGRPALSIIRSSDWSGPFLLRGTCFCSTSPSDPNTATGEMFKHLSAFHGGRSQLLYFLTLSRP